MKKLKFMLPVLLILSLFLAGCSSSSSTSASGGNSGGGSSSGSSSSKNESGNNVKVGIVLPLTGPAALYGKQTLQGAEVAAQMINDGGGILNGKKIQLVQGDDQSKPEVGVSQYSKLINKDKVVAITGGVNSSVSMATAAVPKNKMINVVTVSKAPDIMKNRDPYRFRLNTTTDMDGKVFNKFLAKKLANKKVAVIAENTDYGQAGIDALKADWTGPNAPKIVGTQKFELTATDYSNPLTKLKALHPDALYIIGAAISINSAILKQADQLGFQNTTKILAPGNINTQVAQLAGKAAEGVISADFYVNSINNPMNKKFVAAFQKKFNHKPEKMELLGFESIWIVAKAMDKAGSTTDYKAISKIIENSAWNSPRGTLKFKDGQAQGKVKPLTIKNGKVVQLQ